MTLYPASFPFLMKSHVDGREATHLEAISAHHLVLEKIGDVYDMLAFHYVIYSLLVSDVNNLETSFRCVLKYSFLISS
jgi:hypothetical protein